MSSQIAVQLGVSTILVAITFLLHAVAIVFGRRLFIHNGVQVRRLELTSDTVRLVGLAVWLFLAHFLAVAVWATAYFSVGVNPTFEEALYFAVTCYTTLGFGDIVPPTDWRLLVGATSANGLLLFGLTTAVLVDAATRHRFGRRL